MTLWCQENHNQRSRMHCDNTATGKAQSLNLKGQKMNTKALLATTAIVTMTMTTMPTMANQSGFAGYLHTGESTILWGQFLTSCLPGVNAHTYHIVISQAGKVIASIPNNPGNSAIPSFQFNYTASQDGYTTYTSNYPMCSDTMTVQVTACPQGGYCPPNYTKIPSNQGPTAAQKQEYAKASNNLALTAAGAGVFGAVFGATPVGEAAAVVSASSALLSVTYHILANDPSDPNYKKLDQSADETPTITMPAGARICNETFAKKIAVTIGIAKATSTTFNRLSGAWLAKNTYWQNQQENWGKKLQNRLSVSLLATKNALHIWGTTCAPKIAPSASLVLSKERAFAKYGLPNWMTNYYNQLGVTDYTAESVLVPQNPTTIATIIKEGFPVQ